MSVSQQDVNQARAILVSKVTTPVFFHKLAQYGIVPATEAQAQQLAQMGMKLLHAHQQEQAKTAASKGDFLDRAAARLDQQLQQSGLLAPGASQVETQFKTAASHVITDPDVQNALRVARLLTEQEEAA